MDSDEWCLYQDRIKKLRDDNAKLRAALEAIAKPSYQCGNCCAEFARAALKD